MFFVSLSVKILWETVSKGLLKIDINNTQRFLLIQQISHLILEGCADLRQSPFYPAYIWKCFPGSFASSSQRSRWVWLSCVPSILLIAIVEDRSDIFLPVLRSSLSCCVLSEMIKSGLKIYIGPLPQHSWWYPMSFHRLFYVQSM